MHWLHDLSKIAVVYFFWIYSGALLIFVTVFSKIAVRMNTKRRMKQSGQQEIEKVRYYLAATEALRTMPNLPEMTDAEIEAATLHLCSVIQHEAEHMHSERVRKRLV